MRAAGQVAVSQTDLDKGWEWAYLLLEDGLRRLDSLKFTQDGREEHSVLVLLRGGMLGTHYTRVCVWFG